MRPTLISLALVAVLVPMGAQADDISYSYIDAAYVRIDLDGISKDADGVAVRGSVEITDNIFVFANYADVSISLDGSDFDEKDYGVGIGYAWPASDTVSIYGKAAYVKADADVEGFSFDDDGYSVAVGVRARVAESFELEGGVAYVDFSDLGSSTAFGIGARYYFTDNFAAGIEGSFSDDSSTYGAGVRWQWGK